MTLLIIFLLWCIWDSIDDARRYNRRDHYEIKQEIKRQTKALKPKKPKNTKPVIRFRGGVRIREWIEDGKWITEAWYEAEKRWVRYG